jgi:hypothetical protein
MPHSLCKRSSCTTQQKIIFKKPFSPPHLSYLFHFTFLSSSSPFVSSLFISPFPYPYLSLLLTFHPPYLPSFPPFPLLAFPFSTLFPPVHISSSSPFLSHHLSLILTVHTSLSFSPPYVCPLFSFPTNSPFSPHHPPPHFYLLLTFLSPHFSPPSTSSSPLLLSFSFSFTVSSRFLYPRYFSLFPLCFLFVFLPVSLLVVNKRIPPLSHLAKVVCITYVHIIYSPIPCMYCTYVQIFVEK